MPRLVGVAMNKIPVGETVTRTYTFALSSFLRIFGVVWAPLAVTIALNLMMTPGFLHHAALADADAAARDALRLVPLAMLIVLPIRAMIAVGVTELALGLRPETTFVYFSLAMPVWRMIAMWLLVLLVMIVITVGGVLGLGVIAALSATLLSASKGAVAIGIAVCALFFYGALIYIIVRLTFLIAPVAVVEKKIDLARGWQLTRGNFWRIFAIGFLIFLPIVAIAMALFFFLYGAEFWHAIVNVFYLATQGTKPEVLEKYGQAVGARIRVQSLAIWPYSAAATLLFSTYIYGIMYGAAAFSYDAIRPDRQMTPE